MTTDATSRQPKGIPVGGQFAPTAHGEPELKLTAPAVEQELAALIERSGAAARKALRDLELASASLAARKILALYPDAVHAEIRTDSWDNGDFVAGAIVRDAKGNRLAECFDDGDEETSEADKEVANLLKNLDSDPSDSHWAGAFSTGSYGEDLYTIDLAEAAAWTPEGTHQVVAEAPAPAAPIAAPERPCSNGPWCTAPRGKHVPDCEMGGVW